MTRGDDATEPFGRAEARRRVSIILAGGSVNIWQHCKDEAGNDGLTDFDVTQALQYGVNHEEAEYEHDRWRYRFHRHNICVVVQFVDNQTVEVVTCWKGKRR